MLQSILQSPLEIQISNDSFGIRPKDDDAISLESLLTPAMLSNQLATKGLANMTSQYNFGPIGSKRSRIHDPMIAMRSVHKTNVRLPPGLLNVPSLDDILCVDQVTWKNVVMKRKKRKIHSDKNHSWKRVSLQDRNTLQTDITQETLNKLRPLPSNVGMILNNKIYFGKAPKNKYPTKRVTQRTTEGLMTFIWNKSTYRVSLNSCIEGIKQISDKNVNGNMIMKKFTIVSY